MLGELGINNTKFASVLFSVFEPSEVPGEEGVTIDAKECIVGLTALCADGRMAKNTQGSSTSDQVQRLAFAFEIFDADRNDQLDQDELRAFFMLFRRPLLGRVDQAMGNRPAPC